MSLEFIDYRVREEGKLMSSSKIAHYWKIKHDNKDFKISVKESLVSNKFRIFINGRQVKEMICMEKEKKKGFKFNHKDMVIIIKKYSNKRYHFSVNGEDFKKGFKKYDNVANLLTKNKNKEISTRLVQDKMEKNYDVNIEKDRMKLEKLKKKKSYEREKQENFNYEAMDDDFLDFSDFKSVKTIDLSQRKISNSLRNDDLNLKSTNSNNYKSNPYSPNGNPPLNFSNNNFNFNKGMKNLKINSERVVPKNNRNNYQNNYYKDDPLKNKDFLNFDAFDFNSARDLVKKNKNNLQNQNSFQNKNHSSIKFNLKKKKKKETVEISGQGEVNFL